MKARMALIDNPIAKKWMNYCVRGMQDIDHVLLNDKELTTDERRVLMEKREMLKASLEIFVPKEKALELLNTELHDYLEEGQRPKGPFPQYTAHGRDMSA